MREGEHNPNIRSSLKERTTSLYRDKTEYHRRESRNKSKKIKRRDEVIAKLLKTTAIEVPMNENLDDIFSDNVAEATQNILNSEVSADGVSKYAFAQSVRNHKIAKEKGAKALRLCPLMIRLGCTVGESMGHKGGLYNNVAKVCGLPSDRQIRRYNMSNSNAPDGFMRANVAMAQERFEDQNPGADRFDWRRHVTVALDSMHTKGRFEVNHHTNQLVGVANDAFYKNIIKDELKVLEKSGDEKENMVIPEMAKHSLVFVAITWASNQKH